jgi:flagellar hook-associated protein 3 FlgL
LTASSTAWAQHGNEGENKAMISRVSTLQTVDRAVFGVQVAASRIDLAQQAVSTGKQLNQPSDNPTGTAQTLTFRKRIADLQQYGKTMQEAKNFMATSETALENTTNLLRQARQLAVQAASDVNSNQAQIGIANQIQNIINQVGALGNAQYGSRYVFGGQHTQTAPFVNAGATFTYQGGTVIDGDGKMIVDIGQGEEIVMNVTGDEVFPPILDVLKKLRDDISTGNVQATSREDLAAIDRELGNLLNVRGDFGSKMQRVELTQNRNTSLTLNFTQFVSQIEDADLPKSITELQTAQLGYQAALQATASSFKGSLLEYIR